ncbi:GNAT family N-acetyltransferase [Longispora urticae]
MEAYELDDDPARIDRDAAWAFLSQHAYWGTWRTRDVLDRQLDRAWRVVGAYERESGRMVGFGRATSDGESIAILNDVYVEHAHRGSGLGRALVELMIDGGPGAQFRWMLHTADMHPLYAKLGFAAPDHTYMERPAAPEFRIAPR